MLPRVRVQEEEKRELRITKRLLEKYGYSCDAPWGIHCEGCIHSQLGLDHRAHSPACRDRVDKERAEKGTEGERQALEAAVKRTQDKGMSDAQVRSEEKESAQVEENEEAPARDQREEPQGDRWLPPPSPQDNPDENEPRAKRVRFDGEQVQEYVPDAIEEET